MYNGLVVVDSSDPTWLREVAGIEQARRLLGEFGLSLADVGFEQVR